MTYEIEPKKIKIRKDTKIINGKTFNITLECVGNKKPEDIIEMYANYVIDKMKRELGID